MILFGLIILASGVTLYIQGAHHARQQKTDDGLQELSAPVQIGTGIGLFVLGGSVVGGNLFIEAMTIMAILWTVFGLLSTLMLDLKVLRSPKPIDLETYQKREWCVLPGVPQSTVSALAKKIFGY